MGMKQTKWRITVLSAAVLVLAAAAMLVWSPNGSFAGDPERKAEVMSMYRGYTRDFPQVPDIEAKRAIELWQKGSALFVDIRDDEEQQVSMLPGALTQDQYEQNPGAAKDKTLVVYCTISYRSGKFAEDLMEKGVKVLNLQGGILGWVHAGGPVFSKGKQVDTIHVYGSKWDLAPEKVNTIY
jgi:rhodanese-related sulfurtransferase